MTTPDWPTADRAYQQHHAACPQCRAAGTSPNTQQRCPEGAQLWGTYQQAGDPPHFTWLRKRQRGRKPWLGSRAPGSGAWVDALHQPSRDVLVLH